MFTEGKSLKIRATKVAKKSVIIATSAAVAVAYIPMVPIMFITMKGSVRERAAQAVIWPALMLPYSVSSDHTIGGFKNKPLLAANRKLENVMSKL